MQRIKSHLEFETEIYNDKTAKIAERLVTKYTGNAIVRAGEETVMEDKKAVKKAWIVIYTVDEDQFQAFLHAEFAKLIPVLDVVREGELNILTWPLDDSDTVLKTIETMDAMPVV